LKAQKRGKEASFFAYIAFIYQKIHAIFKN